MKTLKSALTVLSATALVVTVTQSESAVWPMPSVDAAQGVETGGAKSPASLSSAVETVERMSAVETGPLYGLALPEISAIASDDRRAANVKVRGGNPGGRLFPTLDNELEEMAAAKTDIELKVIPPEGPKEWFIPRPEAPKDIYDTERDLVAQARAEEIRVDEIKEEEIKSHTLTDGDLIDLYPPARPTHTAPRDPMVSEGLQMINYIVNGTLRIFRSVSKFFKDLFA